MLVGTGWHINYLKYRQYSARTRRRETRWNR